MSETPLVLLKISHDDITDLYFVNNYENIVSNGQTYIAYPFEINLPSDLDDQIPQCTITIDNVSRAIVDEIRTLTGAPDMTISVVLASDPDTIEAGPFEMKLRSVDYNFSTITGTIEGDDVFRESYPGESYTPNNFPGLFAGV